MPTIAVTAIQDRMNEAIALASRLNLPVTDKPEEFDYDYILIFSSKFLSLQKKGDRNPFYIDFLSDEMTQRRRSASLKKEMLARAMGLKGNQTPTIVDATAGLARDSFILASLGFSITMVERSPIVSALLQDGLERAAICAEIAPIIQHLSLVCENAIEWLPNHPADIIYLDPMFPEKRKTALPKKNMQIFQEIIGREADAERLFEQALACATKRVVVKRPRLAGALGKKVPSFSLIGRSSRFDVYITHAG